MKEYIDKMEQKGADLTHKSKAYLRYVITLYKSYDLVGLGRVYLQDLKPTYEQAVKENDTLSQARLLYAMHRVAALLQFKDQSTPRAALKALLEQNKDSFQIAKYFVKSYIKFSIDGYLMDFKETYMLFKEGEAVNEKYLVQLHNYEKLNNKILLIKIKLFELFFTHANFQQLTATAMRNMGTHSVYSPNIMACLAELYSKKGEESKADNYINRATEIASQNLQGVKTHKKYLNIYAIKIQILLRKKQHKEALETLDLLENLILDIYGDDCLYLQG